MKKLLVPFCLILTIFIGSAWMITVFCEGRCNSGFLGMSWSADYQFAQTAETQKGYAAYKNRDYATALREWTPLAKQGDASAQQQIGWLYDTRRGVPQNYKTAAKWYTLAAEQGNVDAQRSLAFMYYRGRGVAENYKTAAKWYTLAAEQGNSAAQFEMGKMYNSGQGVPQNHKTGLEWLQKSAENGNKYASYRLGGIYSGTLRGYPISEDREIARKWWKLAAEQGHSDAQKIVNISVPWWKFWAFYGWWRFW